MGKGQMFLLGALVISSILVILRYNSPYSNGPFDGGMTDIKMESNMIENLANEINNTISISCTDPSNISRNVFHFANFSEEKISERSLSFGFLHVGSIGNKTTGSLNVTVINMLGDQINFTLSINGQSDSLLLDDHGIGDVLFSITPGTSYNLSVSYDRENELVPIRSRAGNDVYFGYYTASLESASALHVVDSQKDIYLN
jgi:hypothetical protein